MPGITTGFQSFVNNLPAPAIAGDFAGANIRANTVAGLNSFLATPGGVTIGQGCWANPATGLASSYYQPNSPMGFVQRNMQGLITPYLGVYGSTIQSGDAVIAMSQGDFWGQFLASATPGQVVYFNPVTGALTAGASGDSVTASDTAATVTGASGSTATLNLTGTLTGTVAIGQLVVMAGLPSGTYITGGSSVTWTLGNYDGTALANISTTTVAMYGVQQSQFSVLSAVAADCSFTAALATPVAPSLFGILTVSAVASGVLVPGQWLSATGLPSTANIQLLEQLTGTPGSTGTYLTNNTYYTVGSTASFDATAGKVAIISSWATQL